MPYMHKVLIALVPAVVMLSFVGLSTVCHWFGFSSDVATGIAVLALCVVFCAGFYDLMRSRAKSG